MENKLVIHCVGLEGLTITVLGADHSIPMTPDVLRVTTLLGSIKYTLPRLPITYDLPDLDGNLNIRWLGKGTIPLEGARNGAAVGGRTLTARNAANSPFGKCKALSIRFSSPILSDD